MAPALWNDGLADGYHRSYPLQRGLGRAGVRVSAAAGPLARGSAKLRRSSPHLFDSGYFVLSALDGAPPVPRALAGEAVNVGRGGQAARLLVVSTDPFNTAGSRAIGARPRRPKPRAWPREGDLVAGVSGGAAILNDYGSATKSRLPLVIGAIVLITFLMLVAILRAPLLAALAVGLNLLSVAAAIGVVTPDLQDSGRLPARRPPLHRHGRRSGRSSASPSASRSTTRCSSSPGCASGAMPAATTPPRSPSASRRPPG